MRQRVPKSLLTPVWGAIHEYADACERCDWLADVEVVFSRGNPELAKMIPGADAQGRPTYQIVVEQLGSEQALSSMGFRAALKLEITHELNEAQLVASQVQASPVARELVLITHQIAAFLELRRLTRTQIIQFLREQNTFDEHRFSDVLAAADYGARHRKAREKYVTAGLTAAWPALQAYLANAAVYAHARRVTAAGPLAGVRIADLQPLFDALGMAEAERSVLSSLIESSQSPTSTRAPNSRHRAVPERGAAGSPAGSASSAPAAGARRAGVQR